MMEDLTSKPAVHHYFAPQMTQYGIKLPCRVAVVGQTDNGKTHSIMHSWLGGNIFFGDLIPEMDRQGMRCFNIVYFAVMVACPL